MRKGMVMAALLLGASVAHAQGDAKQELVARLIKLQQASIEDLARSIVERPALKLMQAAAATLQTQVPPDKREAAAKAVDADLRKYVDEATPILAERALKIAPQAYGAQIEQKFSEDELKQLVAWLESPVNKKFMQQMPELQNAFTQKLVAEAGPLLDARVQALQAKVQASLGVAAPAAGASAPKAARPPARPASK
ncbi:DUF2059 domain-containing protein [Piscinibacter sp.]|uniref:DUF2059 domain-containing protein n=1 Tax=Piscinibacter sp. TaxID=1903157 RepID=UPI0039E2EFB4